MRLFTLRPTQHFSLLQRIRLERHSGIVRKSECLHVQLNSYVELSSDGTQSSGGS